MSVCGCSWARVRKRVWARPNADSSTWKKHSVGSTLAAAVSNTDEWNGYDQIERRRVTTKRSADEWVRGDDGEGIRKARINAAGGLSTGTRDGRRPLRGVHEGYLSGQVAMHEHDAFTFFRHANTIGLHRIQEDAAFHNRLQVSSNLDRGVAHRLPVSSVLDRGRAHLFPSHSPLPIGRAAGGWVGVNFTLDVRLSGYTRLLEAALNLTMTVDHVAPPIPMPSTERGGESASAFGL